MGRLIPSVTLFVCLISGVGLAHAQVIYPISNPGGPAPFTPNTGSTVTITLSTPNWLPAPEGATVTVTVDSGGLPITPTSILLVCPDGSTTSTACATAASADQSNPIAAGTLTTSAYPGVCTNFSGSVATTSADFTLNGNVLTSLDCGGMAVVRVDVSSTIHTFVIPQDSDFDGIPDIWEAKFGPASGAGSLIANADNDSDGIPNLDEYRGVMLQGSPLTLTRLHPNERDLFVGVINPGCGALASQGLMGGGATTYIPDTGNARSLFTNLNTLLPATGADPQGPRIHPIGYPTGAAASHAAVPGEWVDNYVGCSFNSVTGGLNFAPPLGDLDRLVALNAVYDMPERPAANNLQATLTPSATTGPVTLTAGAMVFNQTHIGTDITLTTGNARATITGFTNQTQVTANIINAFPTTTTGAPAVIAAGTWRISGAGQKGLRCVESLDISSINQDPPVAPTIYAISGWTTANDTLYCVIYSERIKFRMLNTNTALGPLGLIPQGLSTRKLRIQTWDGGRWVTVFAQTDAAVGRDEAVRRVVAEVLRFYVTMEYGHGGGLNPTMGTCGIHDCKGRGYINDKDFAVVVDRSTTSYNTFRIPRISHSDHTRDFKLRTP